MNKLDFKKAFAIEQQKNAISVRNIVTIAEFERLDALYHSCFGASSVPTEVLKSWWNAQPKGLIGLFKEDELIGGVSMWSMDEDTFHKIKNGAIKEQEILATNLDNHSYDKYYASEIAIKSEERNIFHLFKLLQGSMEQLKETSSYPASILALGYSPQGINILEKFGFTQQLNANETPDNLPLFRLTINSKDEIGVGN
jgi:hypothetical protein